MSTQTPAPLSDDAPPSLLRRYRLPLALVATVVVGIGLWLTQPWLLLVDEEVDTTFDVSIGDAQSGGDDADASDGNDAAVGTDSSSSDDGGATSEDASSEGAQAEDPPASGGQETATAEEAPAQDEAAQDGAAASGPVLLASGDWQDRDHPTSGRVAFFQLEDGSRVLRLEDLQTDNGPDLFVYLDTDGPDAGASAFDDGINLGRLQGNIGNQTYEIPDDVDLTDNTTVIIWCDRFGVAFGTAGLTAP